MMRLGRLLLWPAGLALGVAAERAAASAGDDLRVWVPDLVVGWTLIACGLVGWSRRQENRFGPLAAATGFCWFLGNFAGVDNAVIAWVAGQTLFLYRGPLFHLVIGYPFGRASSRLDRSVVVAGYATSCIPEIWTSEVATVALSSLLVVTSAHAYANSSGRARHARLSALRAAIVLAIALAGGALARLAFPSGETDELTRLALEVALCAIAVGLLTDLLSSSRERAAVTDLVVELGERRSTSLSGQLARLVGDPTLTIGYWPPSAGGYVDPDGRPIELPTPGSGRAVTLVGSESEPIASLIHDPAVLDDPVLLEAASVATELSAQNAHLQAGVRIQLTELEASRRRILVAGDAERENLEQHLHEGAERVLEELAEQLRRGRTGAQVQATGDRIGEAEARLADAQKELRELASGLYPRLLSERGLEGALRSLTERSPVPVTLTISANRLPPDVETAAYFICSEALANTAKYSSASATAVSVAGRDGLIEVTIEDDGDGGADPSRGTGLRGLADRIDALGGTLRIESEPGHGTRLVAEIPYPAEAR